LTTYTGQVTQVTHTAGNTTTFSYADNFFTDSASGTNPPTALAGTRYTLAHTKGRLSHTSAAGRNALTLHSYDPTG
jgi:hypothetical protein